MIFHDGRFKEKGYVLEGVSEWGCSAIVSPTKIPIPTSDKALHYHLRKGAMLVEIMEEPPLFSQYYLNKLKIMSRQPTECNQRLLLLIGNNGDRVREVYRSVARNWIRHGGVSFILDGIDDIYLQLKKFEKGVA